MTTSTTFMQRARLAATAVLALAMPVGEAVASSVYIATDQTGAQTFINRTDVSYWTFATNANAVTDFAGGFFEMKKGGGAGPTADVKFVVIAGDYSTFQSSYDASTGVYSGSSVISASAAASSLTGSFGTLTLADTPVTLAANSTYTAVLFSAASGVGNDTFYVKNNGDLFWSDASGQQIAPTGYTAGGDLVTTSGGATAVPGTGVLALAGLGLAARRRRR